MLFFSVVRESQLGYCAIFACVGLGFLFLRRVDGGDVGPGYWAVSFLLNSLGFLFWSGSLPLPSLQYYLIGEAFHVSGFLFLVCGTYRFTGGRYRPRNLAPALAWIAAWIGSIFALLVNQYYPMIAIKGLRAVLFIWAGLLILRKPAAVSALGRRLAGWSLIAWGAYVFAFAFVKVDRMENIFYGLLAGFQVLAAFGMVVMIVDKMRLKAEESARRADRLEGLLPICSYCKKIRDGNGEWQTLELYIEDRSSAEFSHGICPDCMRKHQPDRT